MTAPVIVRCPRVCTMGMTAFATKTMRCFRCARLHMWAYLCLSACLFGSTSQLALPVGAVRVRPRVIAGRLALPAWATHDTDTQGGTRGEASHARCGLTVITEPLLTKMISLNIKKKENIWRAEGGLSRAEGGLSERGQRGQRGLSDREPAGSALPCVRPRGHASSTAGSLDG